MKPCCDSKVDFQKEVLFWLSITLHCGVSLYRCTEFVLDFSISLGLTNSFSDFPCNIIFDSNNERLLLGVSKLSVDIRKLLIQKKKKGDKRKGGYFKLASKHINAHIFA